MVYLFGQSCQTDITYSIISFTDYPKLKITLVNLYDCVIISVSE
jgi:hypothetical protein